MRVLATCIGSVVAATDCEVDHVSALQHNAVASAQTKMHQRAASDGKLGSLEAVLAGKGPLKCDSEQAAEMVSCFRVGNVSALDVLSGGESIAEAFKDIAAADDATCKTLKSDLHCLQKNPCYNRELYKLPYKHQGEKMSAVCKANGQVPVMEGADGLVGQLTWGMVCEAPTSKLLCQAAGAVQEVKDLFDGCEVKCDEDKSTHNVKLEALLPADTPYRARKSTSPCHKGFVVERKADCKNAATNLKKKYMSLTKSHRPHGCYMWRNKIHWNSAGKTKKQRGRHPICVK